MTGAAWYTLGVLAVMVGALVRGVARPDLVMLGALGLLLLGGVLGPEAAFAGFSNPAVITIGSLFVVAAGVERTGALSALDPLMRPRSGRVGEAVLRLMLPTAVFSGVLNNTPIVAMLIPRVQAWARRSGVPASKLLLPLSTAAIVGGWLTLIGTSTNVVVHGLLIAEGLPGLGFFDLAWVGVPVVALVLVYYAAVGHRLLPDGAAEALGARARDYRFDLAVAPDAPFAGRTVEEAGLRTLGDAYLAHLRRADAVVEVAPETALAAGDVLAFVGDVRAHDELLARPGSSGRPRRSATGTGRTSRSSRPSWRPGPRSRAGRSRTSGFARPTGAWSSPCSAGASPCGAGSGASRSGPATSSSSRAGSVSRTGWPGTRPTSPS